MCSVSGTWTQSKHLVIQTAACFLQCFFFFCTPHDPPATLFCFFLPFLSWAVSSHMAQGPDNVTNIFPWQRWLRFPFTSVRESSPPFLGRSDSHLLEQLWAHYTQSAPRKIEELQLRQQIFFAGRLMWEALRSQLTNYLFCTYCIQSVRHVEQGQKGREEVRDILIHTSMQHYHVVSQREENIWNET